MSARNEVFLACTMACATLTSCAQIIGIEDLPPVPIDAAPPPVQKTIPATDKVDVLVIVDNSETMKDEQSSLAITFPTLIDSLQGPSGLPNLHIGVVSTDMGAREGIPNCGFGEDSDDGALQYSFTNDPQFPKCSDGSLTLDGRFIRDAPGADGTRVTNYTGGLADVFGCMAMLGIDGCGFELTLAAMRRAFENPDNAGFVREDAMLAVVFLTDEDDCSASGPDMYNPNETSVDSPLGPLDSYRCFEFGVECNPDAPRELGTKYECKPRESSPYMPRVQEYVDFLRGLKPDPQQIALAGIIGVDSAMPDKPLEVIMEMKQVGEVFSLVPVCQVTNTEGQVVAKAAPAVRLRAFLDAFPGRNVQTSICEQDITGALSGVGALIARTLSQRWCLPADVDRASGEPGIQHACQVRELSYDGTTVIAETPLAECTVGTPAPGEPPCWELVAPSARCDAAAPVELVIRRAEQPPSDAWVEVSCNAS